MKPHLARIIGWLLLLLVGPAPAGSLYLAAAVPACQMACCKRAGHCLCARHSDGPTLEERTTCASGCCRLGVGPSRTDAMASMDHTSIAALITLSAELDLPSIPSVPSVTDPFLYQRPPPVRAA